MVFLKISDKTIINLEQITEVDIKNKSITLSSGHTYYLTPLTFKEIENVVKENKKWCN